MKKYDLYLVDYYLAKPGPDLSSATSVYEPIIILRDEMSEPDGRP
jgi:hypothetical protein